MFSHSEAAYLCGQFGEMESLVGAVLQNAKGVLDQVKAYEVKIQAYVAQRKLGEAIKTGLAVLNLLGVRLPKNPSKLDVLLGLVRTKLMLAGKPIENLLALPKMTAPDKKAAIRILNSIASAAYFAAPNLMPLLTFKGVGLSVKYGNALSSPASYGQIHRRCNYGFV